jgi:hypothetical protein
MVYLLRVQLLLAQRSLEADHDALRLMLGVPTSLALLQLREPY